MAALMKTAYILPRINILIKYDPEALFFAEPRPRREYDPETGKRKLVTPTEPTPTTILSYDMESDTWKMNPDGSDGVLIFLGIKPDETTTHIRVTSMSHQGRSVFGTPYPTIHPKKPSM